MKIHQSFHHGFLRYLALFFFLLFCGCSAPYPQSAEQTEQTVVAVWNFENLTPQATALPDVGELFAAKVIETFKETAQFTVVERERMILALEELHLGTGEFVEESTRLRIGKFVKAQLMVFGSYMSVGDTVRIDLRLVDVNSGTLRKTAERMTDSSNIQVLLSAVNEAAHELL